jgi:hypothetical protein
VTLPLKPAVTLERSRWTSSPPGAVTTRSLSADVQLTGGPPFSETVPLAPVPLVSFSAIVQPAARPSSVSPDADEAPTCSPDAESPVPPSAPSPSTVRVCTTASRAVPWMLSFPPSAAAPVVPE